MALLFTIASAFCLASIAVGVVGYAEHTHAGRYTALGVRPARVAIVDLARNRVVRGSPPASLLRWQRAAEAASFEVELLDSLTDLDAARSSGSLAS